MGGKSVVLNQVSTLKMAKEGSGFKILISVVVAILVALVIGGIIVLAILVADHRPDIQTNDADILELQNDLKNQIALLDGKITQAKTELNGNIANAKSVLTGEIGNAKTTLNATINAAKSELSGEITATNGALISAKSELNGKIDLEKGNLEQKVETAKADLTVMINEKINATQLNGAVDSAKTNLENKIQQEKILSNQRIMIEKQSLTNDIEQAKTDLIGNIKTNNVTLNEKIVKIKFDLEGEVALAKNELGGKIVETNNQLVVDITRTNASIEKINNDIATRVTNLSDEVTQKRKQLKSDVFVKLESLNKTALQMGDDIEKVNKTHSDELRAQETTFNRMFGEMQAGYSSVAAYLGDQLNVTGLDTTNGNIVPNSKEGCLKYCKTLNESIYMKWEKGTLNCYCIGKENGGEVTVEADPNRYWETYTYLDRLYLIRP